MSNVESPFQQNPPSTGRLLKTTAISVVLAIVVLVTVVLPSEYGIDPTGFGKLTGLDALSSGSEATRTFEIVDVIGGNESYRDVEIPDFGDPVPLPNPAIYQERVGAVQSHSQTVRLEPYDETELKVVLQESQVITYDWSLDQGVLYVDFHGHDPEMGDDFWVRYRDAVDVSSGAGSLVAPFKGEHGWYFVNYNDYPIEITLQVSGYFDELIDYGTWNPLQR